MDKTDKRLTWLEVVILVAIIVVIVIAALVLLGPQLDPGFGQRINSNLWLHIVRP